MRLRSFYATVYRSDNISWFIIIVNCRELVVKTTCTNMHSDTCHPTKVVTSPLRQVWLHSIMMNHNVTLKLSDWTHSMHPFIQFTVAKWLKNRHDDVHVFKTSCRSERVGDTFSALQSYILALTRLFMVKAAWQPRKLSLSLLLPAIVTAVSRHFGMSLLT